MRRIVVLGLLLASCSVDVAETTTTVAAPATTASPVSTTSTTEATTTTTVPEVVVLGYSNSSTTLRMQVGRIYLHDLNLVPVALQFSESGWDLFFVGDDLLGMFHSTEDLVAFHLSFFPGMSADEVAADLSQLIETEIPGLEPVEVGGVAAGVFEVGPGFGRAPFDADRPCLAHIVIEERVLDARVSTFLRPCSVNRVWLVEFDDLTVALHVSDVEGTEEEPGDLAAVEPLIDEFLAAIAFNP